MVFLIALGGLVRGGVENPQLSKILLFLKKPKTQRYFGKTDRPPSPLLHWRCCARPWRAFKTGRWAREIEVGRRARQIEAGRRAREIEAGRWAREIEAGCRAREIEAGPAKCPSCRVHNCTWLVPFPFTSNLSWCEPWPNFAPLVCNWELCLLQVHVVWVQQKMIASCACCFFSHAIAHHKYSDIVVEIGEGRWKSQFRYSFWCMVLLNDVMA